MSLRDDFLWGTATASYQIEGAWDEDGKSPNIWDTYTHESGNIANRDTGDVACDHYHKYKEDVALMKELGINSYRLSLSWSRIIPGGLEGSEVNPKGVEFYNNLINKLLANDIKPLITLYHWDLPQSVQEDKDGLLNDEFYKHFTYYARVCFENFGDRVKHWLTFNEPWCICVLGFAAGVHAPGRLNNPGVEPYVAAHNLLIAHAETYHLYQDQFNQDGQGKIGITLNSEWWQDVDEPDAANSAVITQQMQDGLDFSLGWFASPIWGNEEGKQDYPVKMRKLFETRGELREKLVFSPELQAKLRHSSDFFGLNHYSTQFVSEKEEPSSPLQKVQGIVGGIKMLLNSSPSVKKAMQIGVAFATKDNYLKDLPVKRVNGANLADGKTGIGWDVVPFGFRKLLQYIHSRYKPQGGIIVTENGCAYGEPTEGAESQKRIAFLESYFKEMKKAVSSGVDLRGYFLWSLMDNFEWSFGYEKRFGIIKVDYTRDDRKRTPREAFYWYQKMISSPSFEAWSRL